MTASINFDQPFITRWDGGKGYIDPAWYRVLVDTVESATSTVDLQTDVTGVLPVPNGGTGLSTGNAGELLSFTGAGTIGPVPVAALGSVLHSNPTGLPTWGVVDLASEVGGVLAIGNGGTGGLLDVPHGGTGTTTSTGVGDVVLNTSPDLFGANMHTCSWTNGSVSNALLIDDFVLGPLTWSFLAPNSAHLLGVDRNTVSVTAAATTLLNDEATFFVVHDRTSGGITVGVMDATGGVVIPAAFAGIAGIAFTRLAGTGLQAAVTAGANPRSLSTFAISIGVA